MGLRMTASGIDRNMFGPAVGLVMSQIDVAGKFGAGFARDRSDFSGRNFDPERLRAVLPVVRDQAYGQLSLAEAMLAGRRPQVRAGRRAEHARLRAYPTAIAVVRTIPDLSATVAQTTMVRRSKCNLAKAGVGQLLTCATPNSSGLGSLRSQARWFTSIFSPLRVLPGRFL
jgi:hypothetical protein